jgi:phage host-nuclease inhibitor protein Gam
MSTSQQRYSVLLSRIGHIQKEFEKLQSQLNDLRGETDPIVKYINKNTILTKTSIQNTICVIRQGCETLVLPKDVTIDGYTLQINNQSGNITNIMSEQSIYSIFFAPRGSNLIILQAFGTLHLTYINGFWHSVV